MTSTEEAMMFLPFVRVGRMPLRTMGWVTDSSGERSGCHESPGHRVALSAGLCRRVRAGRAGQRSAVGSSPDDSRERRSKRLPPDSRPPDWSR